MSKAVFTTKLEPTYDDLPEERYHFPRTYLRQVEATVGDWVIYYEPRRTSDDVTSRGGRQAYFATARVSRLIADPIVPDRFYALIEDYLEFDHPVPFHQGEYYYESALRRADGATNKGAFGRAVRPIPDAEYDLILRAGFTNVLAGLESQCGDEPVGGFADETATFDRPIVERLVTRPFRDVAFSGVVKLAYSQTCAFTGICLINGGGRAEVQAAHIRPVSHQGPDSVRNGLALSGTLHWMFDRGLISIDEDYSLLIANSRVPATVARVLNPDRRLRLPERLELWPHPQFLRYHREKIFAG